MRNVPRQTSSNAARICRAHMCAGTLPTPVPMPGNATDCTASAKRPPAGKLPSFSNKNTARVARNGLMLVESTHGRRRNEIFMHRVAGLHDLCLAHKQLTIMPIENHPPQTLLHMPAKPITI